uniref:Uncharacterized protein n=1 Tax=Ditylenchus dipsaci TaxID=166011 RepID=A0A915EI37_9BILA
MYYFELRRVLRRKIRSFQQSPTGKNLTQLPKLKLAVISFGFFSAWHFMGQQITEYKNADSIQKAAEAAAIKDARQEELEERHEQEKKRRRAVAEANRDQITSRPMISVAKTQYPLDCD